MRDTISVNRAYALHPKVRKEVIDTIDQVEAGFPKTVAIRIVQGLRTFAEQAAIYAQGRTKPGPIVTHAKPGRSFHNFGTSFDFAILYDKDGNGSFEALSWDLNYDFDKDGVADWQEVVQAFKAKGWEWGGDWSSKFKDNPHLQKTFSLTVDQMLAKHNNKEFIEGTSYIVL